MDIRKDTVKHVAHLARIDLESKELETLSLQLKEILDFIDKLSKLDTKDTPPSSHILPINNVLRDDVPASSLPLQDVLENAPLKKDNFFIVPKIIE